MAGPAPKRGEPWTRTCILRLSLALCTVDHALRTLAPASRTLNLDQRAEFRRNENPEPCSVGNENPEPCSVGNENPEP
jgi:hypothetical protein